MVEPLKPARVGSHALGQLKNVRWIVAASRTWLLHALGPIHTVLGQQNLVRPWASLDVYGNGLLVG